jgi:HD-like signal output (HDOD) protein
MTKLDIPLLEQIVEFAERRQVLLPVFSDVSAKLHAATHSDRYDMTAIESAIDSDTVLATEVLRVANSAFFGGLSEVTTIRSAVLRLGFKRITNLVLLASEKNRYTAGHREIAALLRDLWRHSSCCALAADWIAQRARYQHISGEAFIGGLIHDIGKLFLLRVLDEMMTENPGEALYSTELIAELLNHAHAVQGHRLLTGWRLPEVYAVIVRDHHSPTVDPGNIPLLIVRLADHACNKLGIGLSPEPSMVLAATGEAQALGLNEISLAELEIAVEDLEASRI